MVAPLNALAAALPPDAADTRSRLVWLLAASWGLCSFLPVGVGYAHLLLVGLALAAHPARRERWRQVARGRFAWPLAFFVAWALVVATFNTRFPETGSRLFHVLRTALTLSAALMLTPAEARAALRGFLLGAGLAALVVLAHHAVGLQPWTIWRNLLDSRGNQSSQNMILLATASACALALGLRAGLLPRARAAWLAFALLLAAVLLLHAQSRNSQLVLAAGWLLVVVHRWRSLRGVALALVLVAAASGAAWQFSPTTQARFRTAAAEFTQAEQAGRYTTSVGVRWRMWNVAAASMAAHPMAGEGLGAWLPVWSNAARGMPDGFDQTNNPHNDYLLWGMEAGVPGLLSVALLLGGFVALAWRRTGVWGAMALAWGGVTALTAVFNAPLRDAAFGLSMLWLTGCAAAAAQSGNSPAAVPAQPPESPPGSPPSSPPEPP